MKPIINYPELGGVDQLTRFYIEGDTIVHPSGHHYRRVDGKWVVYTPVPLPEQTDQIVLAHKDAFEKKPGPKPSDMIPLDQRGKRTPNHG